MSLLDKHIQNLKKWKEVERIVIENKEIGTRDDTFWIDINTYLVEIELC